MKYIWMYVAGAVALVLLSLVRLKFGNGANTAIASFSLTSTVIYAVYYLQSVFRKTERNKRS